jgi:hypothetical protein
MTTTKASGADELAELGQVAALADQADQARDKAEGAGQVPAGEGAPQGGSPGEPAPMDMGGAARFLTKMVVKTAHRFVPDLFSAEDQAELAELMRPVLVKHENEILGFLGKWAEELMLAAFLGDKLLDGIDRARETKANAKAKKAPTDPGAEKPAAGPAAPDPGGEAVHHGQPLRVPTPAAG